MTGCVPDPEAPQLWGSCRTKAELWLVLMMETLKCWPVLCLRDVFIVPIVTSPDQRCHVSLCSPRVSVNTAPRGHDYSFSPLSASAPLFVHLPPPICPSFPGTGDLIEISVTMRDLSAIVFPRVIFC